jgi:hypothetical protein
MLALTLCALPAQAASQANGLVILFTDYGNDSLYVGSLKGAIYAKNGEARIDTLTNSVPAFDLVAGAHLLMEGCMPYPKGTTFSCVVDPGVGTDRKCIVLETKAGHRFVAPDNGLLTLVADRYGVAELRECTNPELWLMRDISTTFHGRDIFGPVAGALAGGVPMAEVGDKLESMVRIDIPVNRVEANTLHGSVMREDPYGNLITTIRGEELRALGIAPGDRIAVIIGDASYSAPWVTTYGSVPEGERLIVLQSSGFVECAINQRSMAKAVGQGVHAPVTMRKALAATVRFGIYPTTNRPTAGYQAAAIPGTSDTLFLKEEPAFTNSDIQTANASQRDGLWNVQFRMTEEASERFYTFTKQNVNKKIAIVIDDRVISAPHVNEAIRGNGEISGNFTRAEAERVANGLGK